GRGRRHLRPRDGHPPGCSPRARRSGGEGAAGATGRSPMSAAITFPSAPPALDTRCGRLAPGQYVEGILAGERGVLSRFITLLESQLAEDRRLAQRVLTTLLPYSGRSIRVGITGVPGAGKSTLIESLGQMLIGQGHRVAVL